MKLFIILFLVNELHERINVHLSYLSVFCFGICWYCTKYLVCERDQDGQFAVD